MITNETLADYRARIPIRRVALIACSATKLDRPAPARELYRGLLFRAAVRWAEANCDAWYVLSALHHVLHPDDVVEPYDLTLADLPNPPYNMTGIRRWASTCRGRLMGTRHGAVDRDGRMLCRDDVAYLLAGEPYRRELVPMLEGWGVNVRTPLVGMGIGRQKQWLAVGAVEAEMTEEMARE